MNFLANYSGKNSYLNLTKETSTNSTTTANIKAIKDKLTSPALKQLVFKDFKPINEITEKLIIKDKTRRDFISPQSPLTPKQQSLRFPKSKE